MLNKLSIATFALSALVMTACDGSAVTECTTDADCPAEQPVCDTSSDPGVCVPEDEGDDPVCEEDLDCQLANNDSATTQEDCASNDDCDAGDNCVEDQLGVTYCVTLANDQSECDAIGGTYTDLTDVDGGDFGGCLADGSCTEDGQCE